MRDRESGIENGEEWYDIRLGEPIKVVHNHSTSGLKIKHRIQFQGARWTVRAAFRNTSSETCYTEQRRTAQLEYIQNVVLYGKGNNARRTRAHQHVRTFTLGRLTRLSTARSTEVTLPYELKISCRTQWRETKGTGRRNRE